MTDVHALSFISDSFVGFSPFSFDPISTFPAQQRTALSGYRKSQLAEKGVRALCRRGASVVHCNGADNGQPPITEEDTTSREFVLHDMMRDSGVNTHHARAARIGFAREVAKSQQWQRAPDASKKAENSRREEATIDLARAALEIAAEDDAIISHSLVALPVDAYLQRLDDMAHEVEAHYLPAESSQRTPAAVYAAMDRYIYGVKEFRRYPGTGSGLARDFYLNEVLTRRRGTAVMLALIYHELAARLLQRGAISFATEIELPLDPVSLPRARLQQPQVQQDARPLFADAAGGSNRHESGQEMGVPSGEEARNPSGATEEERDGNGAVVLLTPELLLYEVLFALKQLFWPWRWEGSGRTQSSSKRRNSGGFLEAATANSQGGGMGLMGPPPCGQSGRSGAELASARAAQYRLQRGIGTSAGFGDLRRAMAACERLVLLGMDERDGRDYGVLLFHCGEYELAQTYLSAYAKAKDDEQLAALTSPLKQLQLLREPHQQDEAVEAEALVLLMDRLQLMLLERSWEEAPVVRTPPEPLPEPW
eukprot:TRINITY_DN22111_c0_g1_i1.p1 TRINITY_DN22111_c0_g1~~TRINITY_DN22111_c0_g1_i1.p1  ORF type:complete len:538 (-),score=106.86 TRINITY_DN22111_c0_g1_i1:196-1809(-)